MPPPLGRSRAGFTAGDVATEASHQLAIHADTCTVPLLQQKQEKAQEKLEIAEAEQHLVSDWTVMDMSMETAKGKLKTMAKGGSRGLERVSTVSKKITSNFPHRKSIDRSIDVEQTADSAAEEAAAKAAAKAADKAARKAAEVAAAAAEAEAKKVEEVKVLIKKKHLKMCVFGTQPLYQLG